MLDPSRRVPDRRPRVLRRLGALSATVAVVALSACTGNTDPGAQGVESDPRALSVNATDTDCRLSATSAPSGKLTFSVTNAGSTVTEFYLLGSDGLRVVGEVENIGPGITRDLVLSAPTGDYLTACKPGMTGDGIRAPFQVTDSGADLTPSGGDQAGIDQAGVEQANTSYGAYVREQSERLTAKTRQFVAAYTAGRDDTARALYPVARTHWERIETVAESFGDLDPRMDLRAADLEPGQQWTGWHRLEKDLWPARAKHYTPLTPAQRTTYAADLMTNTETLEQKVRGLSFSADQIANGSRGLLDEVATGKVTGEEEYWSRTDLWDFQANVDGARVGFDGLRPLLARTDPRLAEQIDRRFTGLQTLLDVQRDGDGFRRYDQLSRTEVKELSDAVNALSEPLSRLAAAVL